MCPLVVITGVPASDETIAALAQQLKKLCGSGGTIKDGVIEIQGDHCEKVQAKLSELGFRTVDQTPDLWYTSLNFDAH